jgi:hypothetical protein
MISELKPQITRDILQFEHDALVAKEAPVGPVLTWFIGRLIIENIGLTYADIFHLFIDEILNPDQLSAPISVAASHLLVRANKARIPVSSDYFCKFQRRIHADSTSHRNEHVSKVLKPISFVLDVTDPRNFALSLITAFPNAPTGAVRMFRLANHQKDFLEGWLEAHRRHPDISLLYLDKVSPELSESTLREFPVEDLMKGTSETGQVAARRRKLGRSSWRFLVVIALVGIVFGVLHFSELEELLKIRD